MVKRTDNAPTDFSKQYDELYKILPKVEKKMSL